MKMRAILLFLAFLSGIPFLGQGQSPLAFKNVTVIAMTGPVTQPGMTVVVQGNRIVALGKTGKTKVPKNATVVDGQGKFLIPGLWDMHVHTVMDRAAAPTMLQLCVINGVTGARDMHGDLEVGKQMRAEIADGKRIGPRLFISGKLIDGPKAINPTGTSVKNEAEARQAVRDLKTGGADFVKVYSRLPHDLYLDIADESKKQGMTFVGHVPYSVSAAEASDVGQKSIEHLTGILLASSTKETELRNQFIASSEQPYRFAEFLQSEYLPLDSYSQEKADALFARFVRNKTYQVPTLVVLRSMTNLMDHAPADNRMKYIPPSILKFWTGMEPFLAKQTTPADFASYKRVWEKSFQLVREMHQAGVPILAGTDTPNPNVFPGFSLHDELALFVQAGLTPMQALQTATTIPAQYFSMEREVGTVSVGKLADLVVLDANPLTDIHNTRKINAVVANGHLLTKETLEKMLNDIATANAATPTAKDAK